MVKFLTFFNFSIIVLIDYGYISMMKLFSRTKSISYLYGFFFGLGLGRKDSLEKIQSVLFYIMVIFYQIVT